MSAVDSAYFDLEEVPPIVIVRMTIGIIRHPPQAQEFSHDLVELLDVYKRTKIVINLKGVHYFGSSAFAALFGLAKRLEPLNGKLVLCELDNDLIPGVNILGLGTVVPIVETEAEALELLA